jgi:flagellar motor component MotA
MLTKEKVEQLFNDQAVHFISDWADIHEPQAILVYWDKNKKMFNHEIIVLDNQNPAATIKEIADDIKGTFIVIPAMPTANELEFFDNFRKWKTESLAKALNSAGLLEDRETMEAIATSLCIMAVISKGDEDTIEEMLQERLGEKYDILKDTYGDTVREVFVDLVNEIYSDYKSKKVDIFFSVYGREITFIREAMAKEISMIENEMSKDKDFDFNFGMRGNSPFSWN